MKKIILLTLLVVFAIGCTTKGPYFDFDSVTYYHTDITEQEFSKLETEHKNDKSFGQFPALIWGYYSYPKKLNDKSFLTGVEKFYPIKKEIGSNKIADFQQVFTENDKTPEFYTACEAFYRDILIFKKEGKVTGIAKLCFSCRQFYIIGTKDETEGFGEEGGWEKIEALLSSELPEGSTIKQQ